MHMGVSCFLVMMNKLLVCGVCGARSQGRGKKKGDEQDDGAVHGAWCALCMCVCALVVFWLERGPMNVLDI